MNGEWTGNHHGQVRLKVGDVLAVGGVKSVVVRVTECNAATLPLEAKVRKVETRFGDTAEFKERSRLARVSTYCELGEVLARRGRKFADNFLAGRATARKGARINVAQTNETESEDDMAKKAKTDKPRDRRNDRGGLAAEGNGDEKPKRTRRPAGSPKVKISYAGRSELIEKMVRDGKSMDEIRSAVKEAYPTSSKGVVGKTIEAKRARIAKEAKQEAVAA